MPSKMYKAELIPTKKDAVDSGGRNEGVYFQASDLWAVFSCRIREDSTATVK